MKKSNLYAYIISIIASIILIILNVVNIKNPYFGLLGSFGIGIFSSIIVASLIQIFNNININKLKNKQLELMNTDIKRKIISMLIIFNRIVMDIYKVINSTKTNGETLSFDFENKNINQVINHFIKNLEIIEKHTLLNLSNDTITLEEKVMIDCKTKIELIVEKDKMLEQIKNDFTNIKNDFETRRQILIAGDYIDDETLYRLEAVINLLRPRNEENNLFKNEDISAYKYKFEQIAEISNDKLWKVLGLKYLIFENKKGWLSFKKIIDNNNLFTKKKI